MKTITWLKNKNDVGNSFFGIGFVRAMDYGKQVTGHLIMLSVGDNFYKLFLPF